MRLFDTHCHFDFDIYKRNFNAHLTGHVLHRWRGFLFLQSSLELGESAPIS